MAPAYGGGVDRHGTRARASSIGRVTTRSFADPLESSGSPIQRCRRLRHAGGGRSSTGDLAVPAHKTPRDPAGPTRRACSGHKPIARRSLMSLVMNHRRAECSRCATLPEALGTPLACQNAPAGHGVYSPGLGMGHDESPRDALVTACRAPCARQAGLGWAMSGAGTCRMAGQRVTSATPAGCLPAASGPHGSMDLRVLAITGWRARLGHGLPIGVNRPRSRRRGDAR